jgi:hypothetical protein
LLAEVKEKQDIVEAVAYNQPLINQANLRANNLFYPVNIPDLKEGHTYAWQVTVYIDQTILKKSEVWSFTVKCNETVIKFPGESYRELKEYDDGNYYIADNYLRFSFNNPYNEGTLNYSIECISDPEVKVKNLSKMTLRTGLNKYELDLNEISSMKPNKEYLLTVRSGNKQLRLRFIYKDDHAK